MEKATPEETPTLSERMTARADKDGLEPDHQIRAMAYQLDQATESGEIRRILGTWAKARRIWCEYSGEPLM